MEACCSLPYVCRTSEFRNAVNLNDFWAASVTHTNEVSIASCWALVSFTISNWSRAPIVSLPHYMKIFNHVSLPSWLTFPAGSDPENARSVGSAFALCRPRARAIGSTSMTPDTIDTDVFRSRRWRLSTATTRTSMSGQQITILAWAGFRRDDNTAWWIISVSASSWLLSSNSTLPVSLLLVYPEDDVMTSLGESVLQIMTFIASRPLSQLLSCRGRWTVSWSYVWFTFHRGSGTYGSVEMTCHKTQKASVWDN